MSVLDQFGVDVLDIGRTFNNQPTDWIPVTMANGASALYPKWFHPSRNPDGSYETYDDDGKGLFPEFPI